MAAWAWAHSSSPVKGSICEACITGGGKVLACGNGGTCVPQLGTTQTLDTLGDRMMYRFAIRHFADHDRAV